MYSNSNREVFNNSYVTQWFSGIYKKFGVPKRGHVVLRIHRVYSELTSFFAKNGFITD